MAEMAHGAHSEESGTRRDFLTLATAATGAVGAACAIWPFVDSMNPAADTLALSTTEAALDNIAEGMAVKVMWRGKPVFIRHRTADEINEAQSVDVATLPDPEPDSARVEKPEWLVLVGVCTHLGCIPLGTSSGENKGDFDGWFCPCHGSHYDTSGRIRKGPAPRNLAVPTYTFLDDTHIRIG
ncbi:ubiquinol-cytochrome c reductase iron-sulfur subunit [Alphaproteobacteria bacterium HT1-32]|mgnify:FL=1|nr:ubiquinol-cytochrome c reductase iron-sulfur subunit [Alphaproteobacteria bacterium HT1-32]